MEENLNVHQAGRKQPLSERVFLISRKLIDKLVIFALHALLVLSIAYAGYQLIYEVVTNFTKHPTREEFPFILTISEHIFLYFLPVFILFGLLHYYKFDLRTYLLDDYRYKRSGEKSLQMSKKLFFSNVLSYTSLKIIEELFFDYAKVKPFQLVAIGVFFFLLIVLILFQDKSKPAPEPKAE